MVLDKGKRFWETAGQVVPWAIKVRRHLHQYPELSYQEHKTAASVAQWLREMGLEVQIDVGGLGVKAVIRSGKPGPVIGLRADMDALPLQEEAGLEYQSQVPGVMHACGHDVHTAILLGTAKALVAHRAELTGNIVLLFQHAEESPPGGAKPMVEAGALADPQVDRVYGLHIAPTLASGKMAFRAGPCLASPDGISITVKGKGGHGAHPELTIDPIPIAAQIITALQQVVARQVGPTEKAVISIGSIQGGSAGNIIPSEVTMVGTVRTMDEKLRNSMAGRIERIVAGICSGLGAEYVFKYDYGYPPVVNHPLATKKAQGAAETILGSDNVEEMELSTAGEDFAYFAQKVPGCLCQLGSGFPGKKNPPVHSSRLNVDEACLQVGIAYFLALAMGD